MSSSGGSVGDCSAVDVLSFFQETHPVEVQAVVEALWGSGPWLATGGDAMLELWVVDQCDYASEPMTAPPGWWDYLIELLKHSRVGDRSETSQ